MLNGVKLCEVQDERVLHVCATVVGCGYHVTTYISASCRRVPLGAGGTMSIRVFHESICY